MVAFNSRSDRGSLSIIRWISACAVLRGEGRLESQQLVQGDTQRIDVRAMVQNVMIALCLLGAHVPQCAQQIAGQRDVGAGLRVGQAKITDPQIARLHRSANSTA